MEDTQTNASEDVETPKHAGGRPSKYEPRYARMAYRHALLGATDVDLALLFDVDVSTISNWKNDYPKFLEAIKRGKDSADQNVAESLYKRALGYSHPEVDLKMYEGEIIETKITKRYPPDTTAAIFWLKNRQKTKWRDKHEVEADIHGNVTVETVNYADAVPGLMGVKDNAASDSETED